MSAAVTPPPMQTWDIGNIFSTNYFLFSKENLVDLTQQRVGVFGKGRMLDSISRRLNIYRAEFKELFLLFDCLIMKTLDRKS